MVCNRRTLSQRSPEFGDGAGDEIGVDQEWADVSSAGKGHYLRVGHRGGGSMGVGGNMDRARDAVRTVLAHLQAKGDEAAITL